MSIRMITTTRASTLGLLALMACGEGLAPTNKPVDDPDATPVDTEIPLTGPSIEITRPAADAVYEEGELVTFLASVSDPDDPVEKLTVRWESNIGGQWPVHSPDSAGLSLNTSDALAVGEHVITAFVEDPDGQSASDWVVITVTEA